MTGVSKVTDEEELGHWILSLQNSLSCPEGWKVGEASTKPGEGVRGACNGAFALAGPSSSDYFHVTQVSGWLSLLKEVTWPLYPYHHSLSCRPPLHHFVSSPITTWKLPQLYLHTHPSPTPVLQIWQGLCISWRQGHHRHSGNGHSVNDRDD